MEREMGTGSHRFIRIIFTGGLHVLWWAAAAASLAVAAVSHVSAIGYYQTPCSGDGCRSLFQMTEEQFGQLLIIGFTPDVYEGLIVSLLTVQNLSALVIGLLVYRYGWKDAYSVAASMLILVTGTIFSTDDTLLSPPLARTFEVLNEFGSMYLFFFFLFPDGRFAPRWTVIPAVIWLVPMACSFWLAQGTPLDLLTWPPVVKNLYMLLMHGIAVAAQIIRYRRYAPSHQKRYIRWFVAGLGCYWVGGTFGLVQPFPDNGLIRLFTLQLLYGGLLFLPFSMGIAVFETRLKRRAITFNRTIVYLVLTVMVILVYAMVVGVFGLLLQGRVNTMFALLATGMIAMLAQPVREAVQREINYLVYGEREDPYTVITGLVNKLEGALTQRSLVETVLQNAAAALRLPYAAIEVKREEERSECIASYGTAGEPISRLPLTVQGEEVGWLALGADRPEDLLPPGKKRLLDDLLRQVSIAVQAVRLTEELRRSRERLVGAREEERRRLRRDLHDGLGSSLAGIMLQLDQAVQRQEEEPDEARRLLAGVQSQLREAIADIRRLVYALRPPALDEFGLAFALQELVRQFQDTGLKIAAEWPARLPPLDAAVEAAVYRIVQEALANVIRHAQGTECWIVLQAGNGMVQVTVSDNGRGLPKELKPGIGIRSMKERAEELGGTCRIGPHAGTGPGSGMGRGLGPGSGTTVAVSLPMEIGGWTNEGKRIGEAADHAGG